MYVVGLEFVHALSAIVSGVRWHLNSTNVWCIVSEPGAEPMPHGLWDAPLFPSP